MPKVTDITVLNIDDVPYEVENLSEEVRALVDIYNEWNRKEADVRDELSRFQAAKETLSRQIIGRVRADMEEEAAAAAANDAPAEAVEAPQEAAAE